MEEIFFVKQKNSNKELDLYLISNSALIRKKVYDTYFRLYFK